MTGWRIKARVTGDDAWSVEFTGDESKVIAFIFDTDLPEKLHGIDDEGQTALMEQVVVLKLAEFESENLVIRKLHM